VAASQTRVSNGIREICSEGVSVPDDELEKLRSNLARAYDKRQPFARRVIRAVKDRMRVRTSKKSVELVETEKNKDAA
jgi:hypothetical protein